jgi:hypothetical protein
MHQLRLLMRPATQFADHRETGLRGVSISLICLAALSACQRPLPEPVSPDLLPLTVEQSLPNNVPASAVRKRGGCYFYATSTGLVLIETTPAPGAAEVCRE